MRRELCVRMAGVTCLRGELLQRRAAGAPSGGLYHSGEARFNLDARTLGGGEKFARGRAAALGGPGAFAPGQPRGIGELIKAGCVA